MGVDLPAHSNLRIDLSFLPSPTELKELYRECLEQMRRIEAADAQTQKKTVVSARAFGPLLPKNPLLDAPPSREDSDALQASKNEWVAEKYRSVLRYFQVTGRQSFEQVCQILAMWLRDEGICSPEDLLPEGIFRSLTTTPGQLFANFHPAEKNYADMVMAVLPHFRLMLKAYLHLRHNGAREIKQKLEEVGFDSDAIRAVVGFERDPRSAVSAARRFVADRTELDEDTIGTALSRIYWQKPKVRRKPTLRRKKNRSV